MSCRDIEENLPQTSRNRVHPLQGKPWLGAVDYRCYLAEQTTALQVSLPSNCIAFWGLCSSVRLFVFLYTHKKTVDFIYFCIVLHFIFMGRFYGLFFYLRTLCFKMVWFTVPMEKKKQFIAVTAAAAACAMQENHLASHTLVYHAAQRDTRAWLCKPAAGPLPILTLSLWTPLRCLCFNTGLSHLSTCFLALFLI